MTGSLEERIDFKPDPAEVYERVKSERLANRVNNYYKKVLYAGIIFAGGAGIAVYALYQALSR